MVVLILWCMHAVLLKKVMALHNVVACIILVCVYCAKFAVLHEMVLLLHED